MDAHSHTVDGHGLRFINAQPFSSAANGSFSLAGLLSSITTWKSMPRPSVSQVRERLATGFTLDHLWREAMGLPKGDSKERALAMLTALLRKERTPYALIGGVAVQLYSEEPRTTAGIDVALASYDDLPRRSLKAAGFTFERTFAHSENWRAPGRQPRKLRTAVQFTADKLTAATVARAATFRVRGMRFNVATPSDLVRLKIEAAEEPARRPSKRLGDVTDVQRLLEAHPEVVREVPDALERLEALLERSQWELYWRKHGPPTTAAAARQWWLTPGPRPRDAAAVLKAAPDAVRRVCDREGLPPAWRA